MKNKVLLLGLLIIFGSSCKKHIDDPADCPDCTVSLSEVTFSRDFDWKNSKVISIFVKATGSMIVNITSEDGTKTIHKGYFKGGEDASYSTKINVPSYYQKIKINDKVVEIDSDIIQVDFTETSDNFKNGQATNEIVSYWALDENGGTDAIDAIGDNDGTLFSGSWTNGIAGSAVEFDGTTGAVIIPESDNLDITEQLTLTAWAKAYENKECKVAQKGDWDGFNLAMGKWTGWKAYMMMEDENYHKIEWDQGIPLMNEWYFLAMTYNGSEFKLYVNGTLRSSMTLTGAIHDNPRDFCIGSDNNAQKFFNGVIDEVGVYNTALSAQEIQEMYQVMPNSDTDGDGVPDFEDDYSEDPYRAFDNYWPSGEKGSIAFEDLWPGLGDYDFNDLVLDYQFQTVTNASNFVVEVFGDFTVKAVGASQRNGFGFQLGQNFPLENLSVSGYILSEGIINLENNGTESGQEKSTIIVFDNSYTVLPSAGGTGVNVSPESPFVDPVTVRIMMDFADNTYLMEDIDIENFNPFLIVNRDRSHEIHLPDFAPTSLMDITLFGTSHDDSNPATGKYFKTSNNVPWAILLPESFDYPIEKTEITGSYLHFVEWAQSSGTSYNDWYQDKTGYRDQPAIY